ncbi:MAG: hypothetical protein LLF98_12175 [Clostridium sp.]|nr:hypothetical protein [Clostridium sp.]MCE5221984.1 hypothetical protein [Clostridium sp.]
MASGRPNYEDLSRAEIFGVEIVEKLEKLLVVNVLKFKSRVKREVKIYL